MIRTKQLRSLMEARVNEAESAGLSVAAGRARFVQEVRASLGLMEEHRDSAGNVTGYTEVRDEFGRPKFAKGGRVHAHEFSLRGLAEAIGGPAFVEYFNPEENNRDMHALLEAGPGLDPTTFLNISTYSLAVGGLVEAAILEKFENPEMIGDQLVTVQPTKLNGQKLIGTGGIGDKAASRKPGQPHARAGFGEQWVKTPELDEKALAVEVQQEAAYYDLTGEVLERASNVGDELAYRKENEIIDGVIGVTNTYSYNDTTYNTYQSSTPWINSHSNPFTDYRDYDDARMLFVKMTDPMTGKEILVTPNTILVSPEYQLAHAQQLNATYVEERTQSLARVVGGGNPLSSIMKQPTVLSSPIYRNRCISSTGLNLGPSNGPKRWYFGDFKKAFRWMEAWPLRVRPASPGEYVMLDRGLIAAYFANYRAVFAVANPRYVVENTH